MVSNVLFLFFTVLQNPAALVGISDVVFFMFNHYYSGLVPPPLGLSSISQRAFSSPRFGLPGYVLVNLSVLASPVFSRGIAIPSFPIPMVK